MGFLSPIQKKGVGELKKKSEGGKRGGKQPRGGQKR